MTNADKFKNIFGLYATELWSMPEKDFLKWLNSKVVNCSEIPNNSDTISRQAAIDKITKRLFETAFNNVGIKQDIDETLVDVAENRLENWFNELPPIQSEQQWIPCSERLPEDDTEVLVYLFENNRSPYIAWLSDGRWYTEYFEVEREDEPVAWMPLPEPYKEVER